MRVLVFACIIDLLSGHGYCRRASYNSDDICSDIEQFQRRHSSVTSVASETDSIHSNQTSLTSVDEDQCSTLPDTAAKRFRLAPLVSIYVVPA